MRLSGEPTSNSQSGGRATEMRQVKDVLDGIEHNTIMLGWDDDNSLDGVNQLLIISQNTRGRSAHNRGDVGGLLPEEMNVTISHWATLYLREGDRFIIGASSEIWHRPDPGHGCR